MIPPQHDAQRDIQSSGIVARQHQNRLASAYFTQSNPSSAGRLTFGSTGQFHNIKRLSRHTGREIQAKNLTGLHLIKLFGMGKAVYCALAQPIGPPRGQIQAIRAG